MKTTVTSAGNRRVKLAASLHRPQGCAEHGAFLVEGPRFLDGAQKSRPLFVMVSAQASTEALAAAEKARGMGLEVIELSPQVFFRIADTKTPQGIVAVFPLPEWVDADVFRGGTVVALDGVSDPGNAGTIIRSAAAFQSDGAVFLPGSAHPYGTKTTRSAAGANITLPIIMAGSLQELKKSHPGYVFAGAETGGIPLGQFRPAGPVCIVVGSEAHGLSGATSACLSERVAIPMAGGVDSLNAGVCASIILHHLHFMGNCPAFAE
ncbi:MAG: RNA methyltransferase [Candidatus Fermentibacteraceae bacterium]